MSGPDKVKATGSGGVDEGEALCAAVFGPYDPKRWDKEWQTGLGDGRVDPGDQGSANLVLLRRITAYIRTSATAHRGWLCQWIRDQLTGYTGLFAHEAGWCHYGTFDVAGIAAVAVYADQRDDDELANLCRRWLAVATAWFSLAALPGTAGQPERERVTAALTVAPVGMRKQGLGSAVQSAQLALLLGRDVDQKKIAKQPGYWPVKMLRWALTGGLDLRRPDLVAACRDVVDGKAAPSATLFGESLRVRARFKVWRGAGWLAAVMERDPPGTIAPPPPSRLHCSYGSTGFAATLTADALQVLEPPEFGKPGKNPNRETVPAVCSATLSADGAQWSAHAKPEGGPFESWKHLALDVAAIGPVLWTMTIEPGEPLRIGNKPAPAGVEVGPMPPQTDPKGPW